MGDVTIPDTLHKWGQWGLWTNQKLLAEGAFSSSNPRLGGLQDSLHPLVMSPRGVPLGLETPGAPVLTCRVETA